jgi:ER degradation enhancer, mannosidase alpha-like 3
MLLAEMGITLVKREGTILISQDTTKARNVAAAAEGMLLLQELVQTFRLPNSREDNMPPATVRLTSQQTGLDRTLKAAPAQFGTQLSKDGGSVYGNVGFAKPESACSTDGLAAVTGKIAVVTRGGCMFVEKARNVEAAGALAMIVLDNKKGTSFKMGNAFAMSADPANSTVVGIPAVFLYDEEGSVLVEAFTGSDDLLVTLASSQ